MRQLFFTFGLPKSGTTYLQNLLNSCKMVGCPSEQHLVELQHSFKTLLNNYNSAISLTNQRTGGLGNFSIGPNEQDRLFAQVVRSLAEGLCEGIVDTVGFNDNSIRENLELFLRLFPDSKFIAIFRHPLCCAESAWDHNHRLANEEGTDEHIAAMNVRQGYNSWVRSIAQQFAQTVSEYRDQVSLSSEFGEDRLSFVRYEDLRKNTVEELERLIRFLGCDPDECELKEVTEKNSFSNLKRSSPRPHFFRSGAIKYSEQRISASLVQEVNRIAGDAMEFLGYETTVGVAHSAQLTS